MNYWIVQKENHIMQTDGDLLSDITEDTAYLQSLGQAYHSYAGNLASYRTGSQKGD